MIHRNLLLGTVIILVSIVLHLLLIHPLSEEIFRGEPVQMYSISALMFSFALKCLVVLGLYYYLRAASIKWPKTLGAGKLLYKSAIAFLFLLVFLNLTEFALKGVFTQEVLEQRVEEYQNPDVQV